MAAKLFIRSSDVASALTSLQTKAELLSQAGVPHEAGKAIVCQVLIHLRNNDFVMAAKTYSNCVEWVSVAIASRMAIVIDGVAMGYRDGAPCDDL